MTDIGVPRSLDIGRVIQQLFAVLGRNFVTFLVLAVILVGLPTAVIGLLQGDMTAALARGDFTANFGRSFAGGFVAGLFGLILQATVIYGTVSDLNGKPVSVMDSLRVGLRAFLPLFALGLLLGIAVAVGFILLIVPGVLMALAWCVAVPAYVVERPGIMASFSRSAELTRGSRLAIFGLFLIYVVAIIIVSFLVGLVGGVLGLVGGASGVSFISREVVSPLISTVNAMIGAVGAAVLYVDLRQIRDGVGAQGLADVFD